MASVTLEDVARVAGVSRATASRVVRGDPLVAQDKVEMVRRAVTQLGYVPNRAARSLVTRQADAVAVVVPEPDSRVFSDPVFASAIAGVNQALEATPLQLLLVMASRGEGPGDRLERFLAGRHVDGIVVMSHHEHPALARALHEADVPMVFVGRPLAGFTTPYVDLDNVTGGRLAATRLLERGCRRVATITGPLDMPAALDRLTGWRAALEEAHADASRVVTGDFTMASGIRAAADLWEGADDVDGVFAANDLMALGALSELRRRGVRVPEDVAVVGFDNSAVGADLAVPLTSVTNPVDVLARRATELLLDLLAGRPADSVLLTPELRPRATA